MSRTSRTCSIDDCAKPVWAREMCRMHYARWRVHGDARTVLLNQSPAGAPAAFLDALGVHGAGCVTWPFSRNNRGYAQIVLAGKKQLATRVVCQQLHGPAPSSTHVAAHECGKGHEGCVAPWHLSWKAPAENRADMLRHGTVSRGEEHGAKLNADQVRQIRDLCAGGMSQAAVASRFPVSQTAVSRIVRRLLWGHVE